MARPRVEITKQITSLGGVPPTRDGVSLLIANPPAAYTTSGTLIFTSLAEAEAAGITEAKDLANNFMLWEHVKDFYTQASGETLHVLLFAEATTLVNLYTVGNAANTTLQNYLGSKSGDIKLIGHSIKPAGVESNTGISTDLVTAIPLAQAFADAEYDRLRPIDLFFEGRALGGTPAELQDLRTLASGNVSVTIARDKTRADALTAAGNTDAVKYAQIGMLLGTVASVHVGRNIGRVKSGRIPVDNGQFSSGQLPYADVSESSLNVYNDKGYIFYDRYPNRAGWFFNDNHTATEITRSDAFISLNRSLNKASRIAISTYIEELKDEVLVDAETGTLAPIVVQSFQQSLQSAIESEMIDNPDPTREREISSARVVIDPNQNVIATSKIVVQLQIVPTAIARVIETVVSLINPNS